MCNILQITLLLIMSDKKVFHILNRIKQSIDITLFLAKQQIKMSTSTEYTKR